jgi:aspartyl-tRNA(Asn)/glutamyl-tRNA(Gln) amidotransferase subunit C
VAKPNVQRRDNTSSPVRGPISERSTSWPIRVFSNHLTSTCPAGPSLFMALSMQELERIALLARLQLDPHSAPHMLEQINGFFDLVDQMNAVDTSSVAPLAHPTEVMQDVALRLRPDVASEPNARERNMHNAPAMERGLFLVPKVIE